MSRLRALELFAGIGGFAAAAADRLDVVAAFDHDRRCERVYQANFGHPYVVKNLVAVKDATLAAFEADLWWMSPPCAPHTVRGARRGLDDPRSAGFVRMLGAIAAVRPAWVLLENVPGFLESDAFDALADTLDRSGYADVRTAEISPTALGIPGVRRRVYVAAGRAALRPERARAGDWRSLPGFLGPWDAALAVPAERLVRFGDAMHVVDATDPDATAACFTRAYGRSPVYVGSYVRQADSGQRRLRHFAPAEIAALHGLPSGFDLAGAPLREAWALLGNGLSVPVVREVLDWVTA